MSEAWLQRHLIVSNIVAFLSSFSLNFTHAHRNGCCGPTAFFLSQRVICGEEWGGWLCSTCVFLFFSREKLDFFFPWCLSPDHFRFLKIKVRILNPTALCLLLTRLPGLLRALCLDSSATFLCFFCGPLVSHLIRRQDITACFNCLTH